MRNFMPWRETFRIFARLDRHWCDSFITHVHESRHMYEAGMSHIWTSLCDTYEWVMVHVWISHVTHMNGSRHTCKWVMSHTWMSHVTHRNEPCRTYGWAMYDVSVATQRQCVLQCVVVWCSVLQCVAVWCSVVQCGAVRCSVVQCVAVCCSVLQCVWHVRWPLACSHSW